jgi:hypothetical protein
MGKRRKGQDAKLSGLLQSGESLIMNNLDYSGIAIGATIVALLNLIIVVLVKTETIIKYVERIKGALKLDYRSRAKRIDDEIRLLKKYETIAKERVRKSFVTGVQWNCNWTWNWNDDFEPVNVRGYCIGNASDGIFESFDCDHPVQAYFVVQTPEEKKRGFARVGIYCSQVGILPHKQLRAHFEIDDAIHQELPAESIIGDLIKKAIITDRDTKIAHEIKVLRRQFWR